MVIFTAEINTSKAVTLGVAALIAIVVYAFLQWLGVGALLAGIIAVIGAVIMVLVIAHYDLLQSIGISSN